jgi:hypothetical protein
MKSNKQGVVKAIIAVIAGPVAFVTRKGARSHILPRTSWLRFEFRHRPQCDRLVARLEAQQAASHALLRPVPRFRASITAERETN